MDLRDQLQATLSGSYTLERELGGGGMSRVFVAEELRLKRKVVVKVLSPELAQGISVDRFEREIQTVAALQQANIVPVLTAGDTDGLPFYTMPFVEGESLRARLARGPLAVTEVIGILRDVSKALAYAHQRGVVHRDIKPDNVLISGGTAVVTDFGIAKAISESRTLSDHETLTQFGTSIGTPAYMAPEQAAGDANIDQRADIYALGAMAYELLSGQVVFAGRTPQRMLAAHMSEAAAPISTFRADLPAPLAELIMSCLAKDASARPQSAGDITRILETITSGSGMQSMPPVLLGGPAMFKKALAIYAAAFVAVAILARAAIVGIGLPDWVFPGALIVMALGLPVVLWTGYVQRVTRRALTMTPTFTPGGTPSLTHGTIATLALKAAPRMSWYRTARGGLVAGGAFVLIVAAFMAMRAFGIGPAGSLFAAGKLKASEPIVMTDFSAANGDTAMARVVSFAVRSALAQSSVVSIMDQATIAGVLQRMEQPRTARVDLTLAQGVALREGAKAVIDGDVTALGTGYVVTVRLLTSDSLKALASFQANGEGTKGLMEAADKVARDLRAKAGESLRSVQNAVPLSRAQTASLDALRSYSEAVFAMTVEDDNPKSIRLTRAALTIDSSFAAAWVLLAQGTANSGLPRSQSDSAYQHAFALRNRLPVSDQAYIAGGYFGVGPGRDRAKAIEAYSADTRGPWPMPHSLAVQLSLRRDFARADSFYRIAIAADSEQSISLYNLAGVLVFEGRLDAADSLLAAGQRRFPAASVLRQRAVILTFERGQLDAYARQLDSARAALDPRDPAWAFTRSSELALLRGQYAKWREYRARAFAADSTIGRRPSPVLAAARALLVATRVRGEAGAELEAFDAALVKSPLKSLPETDRPDLEIARYLALAGHADRARAVMSGFAATVHDTALLRDVESAVHTARGAIAAADGKTADALREFRRGDSLPDGPANQCTTCLPLYLGRTFDAANQPDSAIVAYEAYVHTPDVFRYTEVFDPSALPAIRERLGQLYETKGNTAKAAEHYRAFIELWKNADADLQPRVAEARRRLAKLTPVEKQK